MDRSSSFTCVRMCLRIGLALFIPCSAMAQSGGGEVEQLRAEVQELRGLVVDLQARTAELEQQNKSRRALEPRGATEGDTSRDAARLVKATTELRRSRPEGAFAPSPSESPRLEIPQAQAASPAAQTAPAAPPPPGVLPGGATVNYYFDGYFENNFNNPTGRVNDLRAYDVLSRTFSINQTGFVLALDPDLQTGRRYGARLDLQFGQATDTSQGNPANEPRPDVYRNIFQAYGTYVVPFGAGLSVDFGKWASSLGIEGNYAKDQMNYTRSFLFYYLPFYHAGARLHYNINNQLGLNYWIVNGSNQSEPTNGYKDELFGLALQPSKTTTWTVNYYNGQEHADTVASSGCMVPVQPELCFAPLSPAPNGKLHIFDTYSTWNATAKLTLAGEGDYVIQREWANAAPGQSAAPLHSDGGAAYAQYQFSPQSALAVRMEYLSDRGGLFSNAIQALKETTATYRRNFGDGFMAFFEYRRDWSNRLYFVTDHPASPSTHQDTAGVGLVWWYGGKQGAW
jgi:hypothetical protein